MALSTSAIKPKKKRTAVVLGCDQCRRRKVKHTAPSNTLDHTPHTTRHTPTKALDTTNQNKGRYWTKPRMNEHVCSLSRDKGRKEEGNEHVWSPVCACVGLCDKKRGKKNKGEQSHRGQTHFVWCACCLIMRVEQNKAKTHIHTHRTCDGNGLCATFFSGLA